jgi:hypothetical protein
MNNSLRARSAQLSDFMNEQNTVMCYIRRAGPDGWVRGRAHHQAALQAFLAERPNNNPIRIEVPHSDGGNFVAHFTRVNQEVSRYIDEYGNRVDAMMCTPSYAARINRLIDHY